MEQPHSPPSIADERIEWILANPAMSEWLKSALDGARRRDPRAVLNDLELLDCALRHWCDHSLANR